MVAWLFFLILSAKIKMSDDKEYCYKKETNEESNIIEVRKYGVREFYLASNTDNSSVFSAFNSKYISEKMVY